LLDLVRGRLVEPLGMSQPQAQLYPCLDAGDPPLGALQIGLSRTGQNVVVTSMFIPVGPTIERRAHRRHRRHPPSRVFGAMLAAALTSVAVQTAAELLDPGAFGEPRGEA
jgi:hypothetical protein